MDNQRQAVSLEYLAGILDGEGTIGICRSVNSGFEPYMSLGMVEQIIPAIFAERFGGNVYVEHSKKGFRDMYRWRICGRNRVITALKQLQPFLLVKKAQCELVISTESWKRFHISRRITLEEKQRRESDWLKARQLNLVGAAATTKREDTPKAA